MEGFCTPVTSFHWLIIKSAGQQFQLCLWNILEGGTGTRTISLTWSAVSLWPSKSCLCILAQPSGTASGPASLQNPGPFRSQAPTLILPQKRSRYVLEQKLKHHLKRRTFLLWTHDFPNTAGKAKPRIRQHRATGAVSK